MDFEYSTFEQDFRHYRQHMHELIDAELAEQEDHFLRTSEANQRIAQKTSQVVQESGFPVERLDQFKQEELDELASYREEKVQPLLSRDPDRNIRLREEAVLYLQQDAHNYRQAFYIGADVISLDKEWLETFEGEMGNPGKWLAEKNAPWKGKIESAGDHGCTLKTPFHPGGVVFYYAFNPPQKGTFDILAGMYYHGVYFLCTLCPC
jgi:hypothetical protein